MDARDTPCLQNFYGHPPASLVGSIAAAPQFSPLSPGSNPLEAIPQGTLANMTMLAPPGTLERRYALAQMLQALAPGGTFTVLAPKDMGGARLAGDLGLFGCPFEESAKSHHRICRGTRPAALNEIDIARALGDGAPRRLDDLGLWSQPGIFSWDRIDPGTALLVEALPRLAGRGADLGCGIGILAHAVLSAPSVTRLDLLDIDRRAIEAARRNVDDPRVGFAWADVRTGTGLADLDFVVMNPPFHAAGHEDKSVGQAFIRRAAEALRTGGRLWLVANRHLPYEAVLASSFRDIKLHGERHGFKIIEAKR